MYRECWKTESQKSAEGLGRRMWWRDSVAVDTRKTIHAGVWERERERHLTGIPGRGQSRRPELVMVYSSSGRRRRRMQYSTEYPRFHKAEVYSLPFDLILF